MFLTARHDWVVQLGGHLPGLASASQWILQLSRVGLVWLLALWIAGLSSYCGLLLGVAWICDCSCVPRLVSFCAVDMDSCSIGNSLVSECPEGREFRSSCFVELGWVLWWLGWILAVDAVVYSSRHPEGDVSVTHVSHGGVLLWWCKRFGCPYLPCQAWLCSCGVGQCVVLPFKQAVGTLGKDGRTMSYGFFWPLVTLLYPGSDTGHFGVELSRFGCRLWAGVFKVSHEMLKLWQCILCVSLFIFGSAWCHGSNGLAQQQTLGRDGGWIWTFATKRQAPGGRLSGRRCIGVHRWLFWIFFVAALRVGEASHPGPSAAQGNQWTLGIANPSGLNGKLDVVNHLPGDAWILTETQLSRKGTSMFVKGLRMLQSRWTYAVTGAPSPPRAKTDTGSHSGVMMLSRFPTRALPHNFDADVYASGRIQVVGMAVAETWVTVGMVYGIPCNASHKLAKFQTDVLLSEVVDRVGCQTIGPRAIGGDFNYGRQARTAYPPACYGF